jgi:uncharacterized membrane protein
MCVSMAVRTGAAMSMQRARDDAGPTRVYGRETAEFARVVNLSDAVFAIAMTLLVLALDVPDVPVAELAGALAADLPQLGAFLLSFTLVASIWWQHHKLFARLARVDLGLVSLNMALLAGVALVPFPTSLVGTAPTSRAAVVPFIAVFLALTVLFTLMLERVQRMGAWEPTMPDGLYPWVRAGYVAVVGMDVLALVVALVWPLPGLLLLLVSSLPERVVAVRAPDGYARWS